jgi:hypothetical protein
MYRHKYIHIYIYIYTHTHTNTHTHTHISGISSICGLTVKTRNNACMPLEFMQGFHKISEGLGL